MYIVTFTSYNSILRPALVMSSVNPFQKYVARQNSISEFESDIISSCYVQENDLMFSKQFSDMDLALQNPMIFLKQKED